MLELREVFQRENYEPAFDLETPGFNEQWWMIGLKRLTEVRTATFIFVDGAEEVARATLDPEGTL